LRAASADEILKPSPLNWLGHDAFSSDGRTTVDGPGDTWTERMELAEYFWTLRQLEKLQRSRVSGQELLFRGSCRATGLGRIRPALPQSPRDARPANRQKQLDLLI
jgi:hypothetical protein